MERNYSVDEKNCSNLGHFKRLERKLVGDLLTSHPAYRNFVIDYKGFKIKNTSQIKSKERIYTMFKERLKEQIMRNQNNQSRIFLQICDSCKKNQTCKNYQDYQKILEEDNAIVDD